MTSLRDSRPMIHDQISIDTNSHIQVPSLYILQSTFLLYGTNAIRDFVRDFVRDLVRYFVRYTESLLMAPMTLKGIIAELDMNGDAAEAIGFETVLKILEGEDDEIFDIIADMPSLPKLLRQVHKAGFWHGAEFGRKVFLEIMEDERKSEALKDAEEFDLTS